MSLFAILQGQTALEYAVMRGKPDSVRLLLEHGANINMVMENEEVQDWMYTCGECP